MASNRQDFENDFFADPAEESDPCLHSILDTGDVGEKICAECGELFQDNYLVVENLSVMKPRRKRECTLFDGIPFFISEKTRNTAIDIFRLAMGDTTNKTMRKAILLACVHIASIVCEESVSLDDLIEFADIKPHKACRGINFVAEKLYKNATYEVPFFQSDVTLVKSIMQNIGLEEQTEYVVKIISIVKNASSLLNNSHYKSVVCGCILFWLTVNERNILRRQFSKKVKVSDMTIKKKYSEVKVVVLRYLMKKIFSNLLQKCVPRFGCRKKSSVRYTLYKPKDELFIENYDDTRNIKVRNEHGMYLPIDDVTDILQWNILLDTEWYDLDGYEFSLNVTMAVRNKDVTFNFTKYDEYNKENGKNIVANTIIDYMTGALL